jgi:hypothetical protein
MKLAANDYQRLLCITASAALLGFAGCSTGSSGGEPAQVGQGGTGLSKVFVTSNWSRPGPAYLYDEVALPAGGGPGLGGSPSGSTASSGTSSSTSSSSTSSSGGHSGGSSSGGSSSSSSGGK